MTKPISQQKRKCYTAIRNKKFSMTITEIEQAIAQLSLQNFSHLREWFEEFEAQQWDEQIERDAKSGKLDKIAEQALSEYRAGKAKEL